MQWRSIPKEVVQSRVQDAILKVSITFSGAPPDRALLILAGNDDFFRPEKDLHVCQVHYQA